MSGKNDSNGKVQYMPIGMSIGISVGVAIGAACNNIPLVDVSGPRHRPVPWYRDRCRQQE